MAVEGFHVVRGVQPKPPRITIYGPPGVGKTTFVAGDSSRGQPGAPRHVFLCLEDGAWALDASVLRAREGDPLLRSWAEVCSALDFLLKSDHPYKTVAIDSIDILETLIHSDITNGKPGAINQGKTLGYGTGYSMAAAQFQVLTQWLDLLRDQRGMATVLIAHVHMKTFDDPESDSYAVNSMNIHKGAATIINSWSDFTLFADYEKYTKTDEGSDRVRAIGSGKRILKAEARPSFTAKNRLTLPATMDLSWEAFEVAYRASLGARSGTEGS